MTNLPILPTRPVPVAQPIQPIDAPAMRLLQEAIAAAGGWIGFDDFMAMALYAPGWGYYANESPKFGLMPGSGSDFVTAPELSVRFGRALGCQVAEALQATGCDEVWEFGAGSGALAEQLITTLKARGQALARYTIVDVSGSLRARQHARLAAAGLADRVRWVSSLPEQLHGVVVGNEVLDAMPAKLLARVAGAWYERGVAFEAQGLVFADRPTLLRPPVVLEGAHDYLTEIHPQAEGFVRTLADRLQQGAAFFLDYGFPEHEYYHPQRSMGTLMCHQLHQADANPLADVGSKDITVHVNFTGIALAGQEAGLQVLGYASQGRFLLNCGLLDGLESTSLAERVMLQKLVNEHEMGELFKVLAFAADSAAYPYSGWQALGFATGDRSHTL